MPLALARNSIRYTDRQAQRVIGAYAFARETVSPNTIAANAGPAPGKFSRAKWSAEIFDFQPSGLGPLSYFDIIATIGLSSQIKEYAIAGMLAVAPQVDAALNHVPPNLDFWNIPVAQVSTLPRHSAPWWMWRAVEVLDSVPGVGFTVAHKTLHHKRPRQFPLLDNKTETVLPYKQSWRIIHDDLTTHANQFGALERWFSAEARRRGGLRIKRLRMHDILVWCHVTNQRVAALAAGTALGF